MTTITLGTFKKDKTKKARKTNINLWERYMSYAASKNDERVFWYMKVVMAIPCVIMVPTIIAMSIATENYLWFVGLTVLLFYGNIMAHLAGTKNTFYIPLYHATIAFMVILPFIVYLFN